MLVEFWSTLLIPGDAPEKKKEKEKKRKIWNLRSSGLVGRRL